MRPENVLEKALHMVETSEKNYFYKCDQLKSIRQDLTVQRIQNELTVKVFLDNNLSLIVVYCILVLIFRFLHSFHESVTPTF